MDKITLPTPTLIYFTGIAASGKSTLAKQLCLLVVNSLHLDKDTLNNSFQRSYDYSQIETPQAYLLEGPTSSRTSEHYYHNIKYQTYLALVELAKDNLLLGKHCFVQGLYKMELQLGFIEKVIIPQLRGINYKFKLIYCYADKETIKQRMFSRNASHDQHKFSSNEVLEQHLAEQLDMENSLKNYPHLKIDTTKSQQENIQRVLEYLQSE